MYATTINQNGLILLNKAAREALGVKRGDRVRVSFSEKNATIEREMTEEEFFEKLDALKSEKTKRRIRELAGKNADELFEEAMKKTLAEEMAGGKL